jgi:hypothetical protein
MKMCNEKKTALQHISQLADERRDSVAMKFEAGRIVHVRQLGEF